VPRVASRPCCLQSTICHCHKIPCSSPELRLLTVRSSGQMARAPAGFIKARGHSLIDRSLTQPALGRPKRWLDYAGSHRLCRRGTSPCSTCLTTRGAQHAASCQLATTQTTEETEAECGAIRGMGAGVSRLSGQRYRTLAVTRG
jgi:hypothetical protein